VLHSVIAVGGRRELKKKEEKIKNVGAFYNMLQEKQQVILGCFLKYLERRSEVFSSF
jgi:vacuolar-type H+-ATPase subunit D/Vma8